MSTRTTYTSTIKVPIYASWKCPYCDETNFSYGNISCERQSSTTSLRTSKREKAKNEASILAQKEWQQNAYNIIFNFRDKPQDVRNDLFFKNTKCTKCGKKPKWDKGTGYMTIISLSLLPAIISGIAAISTKTSWIAWLIFAVFFGALVYCFVSEKTYIKKIENMSSEYLPVIGSLNEKLIAAVELRGKKLPSPEETVQIVNSIKTIPEVKASIASQEMKEQDIANRVVPANNDKEQVCFCRKCGAKLPDESEFCNKCGTPIVH